MRVTGHTPTPGEGYDPSDDGPFCIGGFVLALAAFLFLVRAAYLLATEVFS